MIKRQMVLAFTACCLLVIVGCNKNNTPPRKPSDSDGIPTLNEVLVVDVEEKIAPPPREDTPAAAPASPAPAAAPAPAPAPAAVPAPQPEPKKVATAQPKKANPLKAAFNKDDVLAVAEDTPSRPAPKAKAAKAASAQPKDKSPAVKKDDKTKPADPEVQAVQETILAFAQSVEKTDAKAFKANIAYSKAEEPMIKTMWSMVTEMNGFEKDMKKAYGQKGVDAIKKNQQMRVGAAVPSPEDIANKMTIKITGNTAKATVAGQSQPMTLVKDSGKWKVQLFKPGQIQGPQAKMAAAMMNGMVQGVKKARKMIGKPGMTPEKVMQAVSQGMIMPGPGMMPKAAKK